MPRMWKFMKPLTPEDVKEKEEEAKGPLLPDDIAMTERVKEQYRETYPGGSEVSVGLNCGQLLSFVLKMKPGDVVVSPANGRVIIGEIQGDYYYEESPVDECEHKNRREIEWTKEVDRTDLPERLKSSLFAWQTAFSLDRHGFELDSMLGLDPPLVEELVVGPDVVEVLKERFMALSPDYFQEQLIPSLLSGMGFEAEATPTFMADEGIDVKGTFRMGIFAGDVRVQVKRVSSSVGPSVIRELRGSLEHGQQGVFITTSAFTPDAIEEAKDVRRLGGRMFLVDGVRLAELILDTYEDLEESTREELETRFGIRKSFTILRRQSSQQ